MRYLIFLTLLIVIIILPSNLFTKNNNYFWAGDQKVGIDFDHTTLVVIYKQEKYHKNIVSAYENIPELDQVIISENKRMTVFIFQRKQLKPEKEILNKIGLVPEDIEWYSFGYIADGETFLRPTNRLSFKLKEGISFDNLEKLLNGRAVFAHTYLGTQQIQVNGPDVDIISLANEIYESGIAEYCLPDFIANIVHNDDPLFPYQYYLFNYKKTNLGGVVDADIDALEAWDITTGSSNIKVAVIDDGVEIHDDLKDGSGNSRIVGGYTPHLGGNGSPSNFFNYHGEACAGIIAASHINPNRN
jgi:serine protease